MVVRIINNIYYNISIDLYTHNLYTLKYILSIKLKVYTICVMPNGKTLSIPKNQLLYKSFWHYISNEQNGNPFHDKK